MRIVFKVAIVVVLTMGWFLAERSGADDGFAITAVEYSARMEALEAELSAIQARLGSFENMGGSGCGLKAKCPKESAESTLSVIRSSSGLPRISTNPGTRVGANAEFEDGDVPALFR